MRTIEARLKELEKVAAPEKPWVTVHKRGDKYWMANNHFGMDPPSDYDFMTRAEVDELERNHNVICIEFIDTPIPKENRDPKDVYITYDDSEGDDE